MYALWSSLKRHRSPPSNLPDPWLIASLQGSILLSDSFSSPCVATGSLMRLILITVYLYQWGSERKADTESMNFNKENPPPSDLRAAATRHSGMKAYFSRTGRLMSSPHGRFVLEPYNWLLCFHYANMRWSSEGVCACVESDCGTAVISKSSSFRHEKCFNVCFSLFRKPRNH